MTKDEFEKQYCKNSGMSKEEYDQHSITLPCQCEADDCQGWASVTNKPLFIKIHNELYGSR